MRKHILIAGLAALFALGAGAQTPPTPSFTPGKLVVLRGGDGVLPFSSTNKQNAAFLDEYDPVTLNQAQPLLSVALPTNNGNASLWFNASAGSEGQGLNRSADRRFVLMTGYTSPIDLTRNGGPPSTYPINRGFGTIDAFTNVNIVYSDQYSWFGLAPGVTQNNPRGIASLDGTNFWGCGTVAGTASGGYQESGCLFYNPYDSYLAGYPKSFESILSSAYMLHIRNNTLFALAKAKDGYLNGLYTFNTLSGQPDPLPWLPGSAQSVDTTNLFCNFGSAYANVVSFDMDDALTTIYIADQKLGIAKFTNNAGVWSQAYLFNTNNLGTATSVNSGGGGAFALTADFTYATTNYPVIYAVTLESGDGGANVNSNRLIRIVDIGNPGSSALVAQTLATAANSKEDFRGVTFAPDLTPLITSQPQGYSTIPNQTVSFSVAAQSAYPLSYQWLNYGTNIADTANIVGTASSTLTFLLTDLTDPGAYSVVVSNQFGAVTSAVANLIVSPTPVLPATSALVKQTNFIGDNVTFTSIPKSGTQPFTFAWYLAGAALVDDGIKISGAQTASLTLTNVQLSDAGTYAVVVSNPAGNITNLVQLTVQYLKPVIPGGFQPASVVMLAGQTNGLYFYARGTAPLSYQWYYGKSNAVVALSDVNEISGSATTNLVFNGALTSDATNYFCVISNQGGSVTSLLASVSVLVPPAHTQLNYSNQVYFQNFNTLPNAGAFPVNTAGGGPVIIGQTGPTLGISYWPANPFDFGYPIYFNVTAGGSGGLGLSNSMSGWYGECDIPQPLGGGLFGAHDGSQTTGGVISFGDLDSTSTNRALGLIATGGSGSTHFGLKLVNTSTKTLNYINLSYLGEYWKLGSHPKALDFGYAVNPSGNSTVLSSDVITAATNNLVGALSIPTNTFPLLAAGHNDGNLPGNQVNLAVSNFQLNTAWAPGQTLWLVWTISDSAGSGQGYGIDNLTFSATPAVPVTAPTLGSVSFLSSAAVAAGATGNPGVTFSFTDTPNAAALFTVWSTTNLFPTAWTALGHPTEVSAGQYNYNDSSATNATQVYYKVTSP